MPPRLSAVALQTPVGVSALPSASAPYVFKKATNACLQNFAWGVFNKNDNFNNSKLVMHGYKFMNTILTEVESKKNQIGLLGSKD